MSTAPDDTRAALRAWILTVADGLDDTTLADDSPLFEIGYIKSLHVPELLLLLEELRGGDPIDVRTLQPGDFRDLDTLVHRFLTPEAKP